MRGPLLFRASEARGHGSILTNGVVRTYVLRVVRKLGVLMGTLAAFVFAPVAQADIDAVFKDGETPEACAAKADGIRVCQGVTETFDGVTNIDVNVILPPPSQGDGPFPAIG